MSTLGNARLAALRAATSKSVMRDRGFKSSFRFFRAFQILLYWSSVLRRNEDVHAGYRDTSDVHVNRVELIEDLGRHLECTISEPMSVGNHARQAHDGPEYEEAIDVIDSAVIQQETQFVLSRALKLDFF